MSPDCSVRSACVSSLLRRSYVQAQRQENLHPPAPTDFHRQPPMPNAHGPGISVTKPLPRPVRTQAFAMSTTEGAYSPTFNSFLCLTDSLSSQTVKTFVFKLNVHHNKREIRQVEQYGTPRKAMFRPCMGPRDSLTCQTQCYIGKRSQMRSWLHVCHVFLSLCRHRARRAKYLGERNTPIAAFILGSTLLFELNGFTPEADLGIPRFGLYGATCEYVALSNSISSSSVTRPRSRPP